MFLKNLNFYKVIVILLYLFILFIIYNIYLIFPKNPLPELFSILNIIAILSTLGAALLAISSILISDFQNRLFLNIDILSKDILKNNPDDIVWKRWPFLPRQSTMKLINGTSIKTGVANRQISLKLGFHEINIILPTVFEDIFDLSLLVPLYEVLRIKKQFYIWMIKQNELNEMTKYECISDILLLVFKIRFMKLIMHIGISLILFSPLFFCKIL